MKNLSFLFLALCLPFVCQAQYQPVNANAAGNPVTLTNGATFISLAANGGAPSGGAMNYVLTKNSATSYDYSWQASAPGSGTVTQVNTSSDLTGGPITTTGTIGLANTTVTAGTYGNSTNVSQITVDAKGRITSASNVPISGSAGGTVTSVSVVTNAGVSGAVSNPTSTPAITLTLGAITPTSVNGLAFATLTNGGQITGNGSKALSWINTLEFAGTDSTVMTFPATSATIAGLGVNQTFTGTQTFGSGKFLLAGSSSGTTTINATAAASGVITVPAVTDTLAVLGTAQTFTAKITHTPTSTVAGLNVGSLAGNPSSPVNGDLWYNSTSNALNARINGSTVSLGSGGGGGISGATSGQVVVATGATTGTSYAGLTSDSSGNLGVNSLTVAATGITSTASTDLAISASSGQVVQANSNVFFRNQNFAIFGVDTTPSDGALYVSWVSGQGAVLQTYGAVGQIFELANSYQWQISGSVVAANIFASTANIRIHSGTDNGDTLQVNGNIYAPLTTPSSSSATGVAGTIEWDASFIYICTATNTWKRTALSTF